jgi:hypothetical protein
VTEVQENAGSQFCPQSAKALLSVLKQGRPGGRTSARRFFTAPRLP